MEQTKLSVCLPIENDDWSDEERQRRFNLCLLWQRARCTYYQQYKEEVGISFGMFLCGEHFECKKASDDWSFFPSCELSHKMPSLREICVAIWYAAACGKGAPRKRMLCRSHHFKSRKRKFAKEATERRNALSVKDLDENELKLLPAKDFWSSKKKQWKKNVYGTFANRNSVQMKNILSINDAW